MQVDFPPNPPLEIVVPLLALSLKVTSVNCLVQLGSSPP